MKNIVLSLALMVLVIGSTASAQSRRSGSLHPKPTQSGLAAEAEQQLKNYWFSNLNKCGESYFLYEEMTIRYKYIHELRSISFKLESRGITEADRLNGYQWLGRGYLHAKAWREAPAGSREWGEWVGEHFFPTYIEKKNGLWNVYITPYHPLRKPLCNEVPGNISTQHSDLSNTKQPSINLKMYIGKGFDQLLKDAPSIEQRLRRVLRGYYTLFQNNLAATEVLKDRQGFLAIHGLAPHMGGSEEAVFLISFSTQKIHCAILSQRFSGDDRVFSEDFDNAPLSLIRELFRRDPDRYPLSSGQTSEKESKTRIDLFAGSWKANLSKSQQHPDHPFNSMTFYFEVTGDAVVVSFRGYTVKGGTEVYRDMLHPDGREYPVAKVADVVEVTRWLGLYTLETVAKKDGKVLAQGIYEVSSDGKTMTARIKSIGASILPFDHVFVCNRE